MVYDIIAAIIVNMVVGALWYGPFFGKQWVALSKVNPGDGMKPYHYGGMITIALIMALTLEFFINATTFTEGMIGGVLVSFFSIAVIANTKLWQQKPWELFFIDSGFYVVVYALMGGVLTIL